MFNAAQTKTWRHIMPLYSEARNAFTMSMLSEEMNRNVSRSL